ncbi:FAD-dependent oxidoreductase [Aquamicrobium sp. LC103]|uniref:NAD(P)/FAD-dependent oxidoreductase n=1 Tax=Aquamicrobium sp. LC103 TaxID=1120658 RepID=UPI00063E963C|nr:FAD-dependent oxidoreductase [Aquamicrobium sp. LC103]TKT76679.1 FAD-dependent oxidoreductase [Aquamicrobium sp. LC103]
MRIIVVGAGIAGLSTAWALTKHGHEVVLLEQGTIPNPLAASGDYHRIIRRAYGATTGYGKAITEAYHAWDELWTDLGQSHYDARGFMCVSREEGDEAETYLDGLKAGGYAFELVEPDEAARRWPFLEPGSFRYAFVSEEGGALHCRRIATGIAEWLRANGCDVRENARVTAVDAEAGSVEIADGQVLEADRVVVTAGAWVLKLFPELAGTLTTYRTAVVYLDPPADLREAWEAAPVILDVGGGTDGYIIPPSGEGRLKFGSGLHKRKADDPNADRVAAEGEGEAIRDLFHPPMARLREYTVREVITCAYTFTDDKRFFCTQKGRALVVSACSGHGYKFGAAVGRRVAEAVQSGKGADLAAWLRAETV